MVAATFGVKNVLRRPDAWDPDAFDFLELTNTGTTPIDLTGVRLVGGVSFSFAGSGVTQLGPGESVVVVENIVAFECRYGKAALTRVAGQYDGKLSDGGEKIRVLDFLTGGVVDLDYKDTWYPSTDGQGMSLVLADPTHVNPGQPDSKASWRASYRWGGSPGMADNP